MKQLLVVLSFFICTQAFAKIKFDSTATGLKYHFFKRDIKGKKPALNDIIVLHMIARSSTDSAFIHTYRDGGKPISISVNPSTFPGSLEEGFVMMAKGDSAVFMVNADSLFAKTFRQPLPPFIKKGSKVTFTIKMVDVTSRAELEAKAKAEAEIIKAQENEVISKFVAGKNFVKDASGIYIETLKANPSGYVPQKGDSVYVHYLGTLMDGTKFDGSYDRGEPISFPVGNGYVIQGWEIALMKMHEGEKIRVVIPSWLAYGEQERGPVIKPYSTLVFEMELIKTGKH